MAIHQLRYAIAYGNAAPNALAAHNHGYFTLALPAVATAFVLALAAMLIRVARGRAVSPERRTPFLVLALCCALALGTMYGVQETLEGAGALAGGGWIGFALAFPAGFLVALALRGADVAELHITGVSLRTRLAHSARTGMRATSAPRRLVELRIGARGPPLTSVA